MRTQTSDSDAVVVRTLRRAGAVVLCHTNLPELSMWDETLNKPFGRSRNPYDSWRTTGGSSGGEGALVLIAASIRTISPT